jgi:hypothetical protein
VVPNHLTLQWRSEFTRLYPGSNILAATPEDFSKDNRERLFAKIITGDWDAVVIGHSSLKKIGLPTKTEMAVLQEQIDELGDAIEDMKRARGDKRITADMEKIRKNLILNMGDTINDKQDLVWLVGNETFARVQELMSEKHTNYSPEGELKEFGIRSERLVTSGPYINMVKHSAYNIQGRDNQGVIFCPENVGYVHQTGHDLQPNNKIGDNALHGEVDELFCYGGLETKDAGKSITVVTNLW